MPISEILAVGDQANVYLVKYDKPVTERDIALLRGLDGVLQVEVDRFNPRQLTILYSPDAEGSRDSPELTRKFNETLYPAGADDESGGGNAGSGRANRSIKDYRELDGRRSCVVSAGACSKPLGKGMYDLWHESDIDEATHTEATGNIRVVARKGVTAERLHQLVQRHLGAGVEE